MHCSAGVGRTGTFIAIDSLIRQIDQGATHINVFECVSQLRYQRSFLVQSIKQYIFVYRAVMEYIEYGDTEIEAAHLHDHYKQLKEQKFECGNGIIMEFEKLNEVMEDPKSCIVGMMDMNRDKNRYDFIIPCKGLFLYDTVIDNVYQMFLFRRRQSSHSKSFGGQQRPVFLHKRFLHSGLRPLAVLHCGPGPNGAHDE